MADAAPAVPDDIAEALARLVPPGPVGVACSGGGDSMALLAMLHTVRPGGVHAATVDHGLRAEAAAEAAMVARFCAGRGVPHAILPLEDLSTGPGNLQANARNARYVALADWARARGLGSVLLAHTLDDQAETVLMRLARGSGAEGLAGMADTRQVHGVTFLRPLLAIRRSYLRDWLGAHRIAWAEDPTNHDMAFDRIKARQALELLAPLGVSAEGLAATADRLRRQTAVLHADRDRLATLALRPSAPSCVEIDRAALCAAVPDTAMRLLADQLAKVGGNAYRPRFRALEPLFARLTGRDALRTTLAGCLVEADADRVIIRPEHGRPSSAKAGRNGVCS